MHTCSVGLPYASNRTSRDAVRFLSAITSGEADVVQPIWPERSVKGEATQQGWHRTQVIPKFQQDGIGFSAFALRVRINGLTSHAKARRARAQSATGQQNAGPEDKEAKRRPGLPLSSDASKACPHSLHHQAGLYA